MAFGVALLPAIVKILLVLYMIFPLNVGEFSSLPTMRSLVSPGYSLLKALVCVILPDVKEVSSVPLFILPAIPPTCVPPFMLA